MGYQALELEKVLRIDRIYSVHYFEYARTTPSSARVMISGNLSMRTRARSM